MDLFLLNKSSISTTVAAVELLLQQFSFDPPQSFVTGAMSSSEEEYEFRRRSIKLFDDDDRKLQSALFSKFAVETAVTIGSKIIKKYMNCLCKS